MGSALLRQLAAAQRRLAPHLFAPAMQREQIGDLRAHDVGIERLDHVVDGALRIALEDVRLIARGSADEDDGDVPGALAAANQCRRVEPVEPGHGDVEQRQRTVVIEQVSKRLDSRRRLDDRMAERLQHCLEREEIRGVVIRDEDAVA